MKQDVVGRETQAKRLSWFDLGGAALLFIGLLFAAINLGGIGRLENWWGLFILLPAVLFLGLGWNARSGDGRFPFLARVSFGSGLIVFTVAAMFLLDLNWGRWWPLMITVPGMSLILIGGGRDDGRPNYSAFTGMLRWFGIAAALLGLTFLADQLAIFNLQALFGSFHWWGFFILIPGIGAFMEAFLVTRRNGSPLTLLWLMILGVWIVSAAAQELLNLSWLSWEGMAGVSFIGSGLVVMLTQMRRSVR
ncbi:MAG: hypothetical protein GY803_12215 [Chloroflexi bacterium]|nr:hypothetical protein [Chloroflexota bacterium]